MKRFPQLLFKEDIVKILAALAFVLAIGLYLVRHADIGDGRMQLLGGATAAVILLFIERTVEALSKYRRFTAMEGAYQPHEYLAKDQKDGPDELYYEIQPIKDSKATVEYIGGSSLLVTHSEGSNVWRGQMEVQQIDMASLAWEYIKGPRNSMGYKKVVILKPDATNPIRLCLFADDNQHFGREMLIQITNEKKSWKLIDLKGFPEGWLLQTALITASLIILAAILVSA